MSGMWPQPQVPEDLLDHVGLVNNGDDAHRAPTPLTQQRIGRIHFLNQLGPALLEDRRARRWGNLDGPFGRYVLGLFFCLLAFAPIDVADPAIIAHEMLRRS